MYISQLLQSSDIISKTTRMLDLEKCHPGFRNSWAEIAESFNVLRPPGVLVSTILSKLRNQPNFQTPKAFSLNSNVNQLDKKENRFASNNNPTYGLTTYKFATVFTDFPSPLALAAVSNYSWTAHLGVLIVPPISTKLLHLFCFDPFYKISRHSCFKINYESLE